MRRLGAALLAIGVAAGCAPHRVPVATPAGDAPVAATYRGWVELADGGRRRFRMSLWAADPDRFHLEISGAVGGPLWIVDAGGGALAVTRVDAGVAYVGAADPPMLDRILGLETTPESLVAAVLGGRPIPGVVVRRVPAEGGGLPEVFEAERQGRKLHLDRAALRTVPPESVGRLGTGTPPAGIAVRPLSELPREDAPLSGERRSG